MDSIAGESSLKLELSNDRVNTQGPQQTSRRVSLKGDSLMGSPINATSNKSHFPNQIPSLSMNVQQVVQQTTVSPSLVNYFLNREARPEFYSHEIYTERNAMPPQSLTQKKAQRIFLRGAIESSKSKSQEVQFLQLWKPRLREKELPQLDNKLLEMRSRISQPENKQPVNIDQGCQVSQSLFQMTQPTTQMTFRNNNIEYSNQPIIGPRKSNRMVPRSDLKPKFHLGSTKFESLDSLPAGPTQMSLTRRQKVQQQQKSAVNLLIGNPLGEVPVRQKTKPPQEEGDRYFSLKTQQRKLKEFYNSINEI